MSKRSKKEVDSNEYNFSVPARKDMPAEVKDVLKNKGEAEEDELSSFWAVMCGMLATALLTPVLLAASYNLGWATWYQTGHPDEAIVAVFIGSGSLLALAFGASCGLILYVLVGELSNFSLTKFMTSSILSLATLSMVIYAGFGLNTQAGMTWIKDDVARAQERHERRNQLSEQYYNYVPTRPMREETAGTKKTDIKKTGRSR